MCRTLVSSSKTANCPVSAGVCQVPGSNSTFPPTSLGVASTPVYADGQLKLFYQHGDLCQINGQSLPRNSTVLLECGNSLGTPSFQVENDCNYIFTWSSSVACVVKPNEGSGCTVKDDETGSVIDLNPLAKKGPFKVLAYDVALCGTVGGSCPTGSAICTGSTSFGAASSDLDLNDGLVTLTYTDGSPCTSGSGSGTHSTLIEFTYVLMQAWRGKRWWGPGGRGVSSDGRKSPCGVGNNR